MGGRDEDFSHPAPKEKIPQFEYDPNKSASNKEKHGIDFEEAQDIWKDPDRKMEFSREEDSEIRYSATGDVKGIIHKAAYTYREERVRLISVRRASRNERLKYYAHRIPNK